METPPVPPTKIPIDLTSLTGAEVALLRDKAELDVMSANLKAAMEKAKPLELGYACYTIAEWRAGNRRATFEHVFATVPVLQVTDRFELIVPEVGQLPPVPAGG